MQTLPSNFQVAAAAGLGVGSHVLYFIKGEHHLSAPKILLTALTLPIGLALFAINSPDVSVHVALCFAAFISSVYLMALFTSITVYRLFFHSLRHFPGPLDMSISKLCHMMRFLKAGSKNHELLEQLRLQYGDFVRTGPNELTIFNPDALSIATQPGNELNRSDWYDLLRPSEPMATTRDRPYHDAQRKAFDRAFSRTALNDYNNHVLRNLKTLNHVVETSSGKGIEVRDLFLWFVFDVLGDVGFGVSFNMLTTERPRYVAEMLKQFMLLLGLITPVPWLCRIVIKLPVIARSWWSFKDWCISRCTERMEKQYKGDIFHYLMTKSQQLDEVYDLDKFEGDAIAILIAGSDTTAAVLLLVLYFLASKPNLQKRIFEEVAFAGDVSDPENLEKLPWLNAVISETMRLYPPVVGGGLRVTGPSGIRIASTFVPAGVTISMPLYSYGRQERCFEQANEFLPERWLDQTHMIKNKNAFQPFSKGRFSCPGRLLAMREVQQVLASLLQRYTIEYAPGEDGSRVLGDLHDHFTIAPGKLYLSFTKRGLET